MYLSLPVIACPVVKALFILSLPKVATFTETIITRNDHIDEQKVMPSSEDANNESHGFKTLSY